MKMRESVPMLRVHALLACVAIGLVACSGADSPVASSSTAPAVSGRWIAESVLGKDVPDYRIQLDLSDADRDAGEQGVDSGTWKYGTYPDSATLASTAGFDAAFARYLAGRNYLSAVSSLHLVEGDATSAWFDQIGDGALARFARAELGRCRRGAPVMGPSRWTRTRPTGIRRRRSCVPSGRKDPWISRRPERTRFRPTRRPSCRDRTSGLSGCIRCGRAFR